EHVRSVAFGGVQPNLNLSIVRDILVPIPPLAEQEVLVPRVRAALAAIERRREQVDEASNQLAMLDQSILAKAFRGDLVPQDPTDEPASVLLDRIRAARQSSASAKPTRTRKPKASAE